MLIVAERVCGFGKTTDRHSEMPGGAKKKPTAHGETARKGSGQVNASIQNGLMNIGTKMIIKKRR